MERIATIHVGDYLVPDGWRGLGGLLRKGDDFVDNSYHGSQFRVETGDAFIPTLPVNLTITGRSVNYHKFSKQAIRVRIEFVHDGEPNSICGGWVVLHSASKQ